MDSKFDRYEQRREPACLKPKRGVNYVNIRMCTDRSLLELVLKELESFGPDMVLIPWLCPPFYLVRGYGMYSRAEARELYKIQEKEDWSCPCLGPDYDCDFFLRKINR